MKAKFFAVLMVLSCTLLLSSPAMADDCAADAPPTSFCLNNPNNNQTSAENITVHITLTGNVLSVHIGNTGGNTILGIDQIAFTSAGNFFDPNPANMPTGWSSGGASVDGFSSYFPNPNQNPFSEAKSPGGNDTSVTFTLTGDPGFDANDTFVVHIRYLDADGSGCSIFLSNRPIQGGLQGGDPDCGGTEIPEPGSLALLGTGLFGAVGALRRKLLKA